MKAVVVENVVKSYGSKKDLVEALKGISFEVDRGELFGIIGPDGAGKTSLFRILTTLLLADSGKATIDEYDVVKDFKAIRQRVGYMPGRFSLYQDLTVEENLEFFATTFNTTIRENYALIKDIYSQIEPFKDRRAGKLSGGMKQKLALSCALIHRPSVLFLDEPTTGVDAVSRKEFWDMLQNLKRSGITILVSTPYMDEANLCDRIALLQEGKLLSINTPAGVIGNFKQPLYAAKGSRMLQLLNELKTFKEVKDAYPFGEYHHVVFHDEAGVPPVASYFGASGVEMFPVTPGIEDCFMDLMKTNE
ncbi:ABC transporter ATP-binding protein [Chitinophagaceae bacterium LB-8]|uniref:ABC transporter ATP-binding protein n=1 Tax=Paraflavisolibacter caeni TaxID=2982496 RepID=A0A9X2Y2A4_9BACT|nr:ABC transporter ATP-binding protein [Paraflavisolibacter caeni]MCU7552348.1 ABC transporter ATP-binding protein [Paraflavisolibacter caeni]